MALYGEAGSLELKDFINSGGQGQALPAYRFMRVLICLLVN